MRPARRALVAVLATAAVLPAPALADGGLPPYFDVASLPLPAVTGKEIADDVAAFSTTYAQRITGSPAEQGATTLLHDEAAKLGYDAQVVNLLLPGGITHAVIATRKGTTHPEEHLVFTAHYDNVPQTINGAYDNGSGATMLRALARSFATVPTNRTLVFAWYNGEEEGTLASDPHAQSFVDVGKKVRGVLGFDMVGIGWPVANPTDTSCLCVWHGDEDDQFDALLRHVNFDVLKFPDAPNLVEVRGQNTRNSDEAAWDTRGYPTLRWAGLKTASNYPAYHRYDDTMATIDTVAGGRTYFEQGLRNTLLSSWFTALSLDNEMPVARATATGAGPVHFDASASSDPDGTVGAVTWDFGDGTTGTGAIVDHGYARKGTYTAVGRVSDGLWPTVLGTVSVPVTVTKVAKKAAVKKPAACRKPARRRAARAGGAARRTCKASGKTRRR